VDVSAHDEPRSPEQKRRAMSWAQRLKRVFSIDITTCAHCGGRHAMGGPIWAAPIHDLTAVRELRAMLVRDKAAFPAFEKLHALLTLVEEELPDVVLYESMHGLAGVLKCSSLPVPLFRSALINAGYRVSATHASPLGLKTDAPMSVVWDVLRCWVREHPVKAREVETPGSRILAQPVQLEASFTRARGAFSRYSDYDSEDTDDYGFGASGRLDVTRAANLLAGADFAHLAEPRTSSSAPASTVSPIEYDMASAYLAGSQTRGRVRFSARGDVRSFTYEDGRTIGGAVVEQGDRDRTISSVTGRTDVALSPATALFVQATGNSRDYDVASTPLNPARDSSGYEVLAGANFEVGALARGEVAAGYIQQEFDSPAFGDVSGLGARASIEYFPTQLTTLTTTVSRTVEDAAIVGAGGYLSSSIGLQADHELLRNVILGGQLTYAEDDYEGIDRTDERLSASLRATYLVNRRLGVSLAASSFKQTSSGTNEGVDFKVNRLMLSLVGQF
jgi:hypothetical protein